MFCGIVDGSFIADKLRLASSGCFSAEIAESKTAWVDGNGLLKSRMIVTESPQFTVSNNLFANSLGSQESISKSHWNTSRIASPNSTDSKTIASSARSEHVAEVHPGFHGIDPTTYMQSAGSYRRSANEFSSSPSGGLSAPQRGPSANSFSESTPHGVRSPSAIRQERAYSSGLSSRQQVTSAGREAPPASNPASSRGASISINREAGSAKASAGVVAPTSSQRVATPGAVQRPATIHHSSSGVGAVGGHSAERGGTITGTSR